MTHAFFKALLFLAAGIIIEALHEEHDIGRMGGLRKELPIAFWTFLIGGCALAGLPLITAGAYSKDWILASATPNRGLWLAAVAGVVLTSLYTFRLIFLVFFGPQRTAVSKRPGLLMQIPILVLAFFSIVGGFDRAPFRGFLSAIFAGVKEMPETSSSIAAAIAFLVGLGLAAVYVRRPLAAANPLRRLWHAGWGFDWLYDRLFVRPVVWAARVNRGDAIDSIYDGVAAITKAGYRALAVMETGNLRWYAAAIAGGAVLFVAVVMFL